MTARGVRIAVLLVTVASGACRRSKAASDTAATAAPDSLPGVVSVTGTGFDQHLVLQRGSRPVALAAAAGDSAALTRLGGVEVMVFGSAEGPVFRVTRFEARSVNGAPVVDGVIRIEGERVVLETSRGRLTLGNPPPALKGMSGTRVWVGGAVDVGPNSYGVIRLP